MDHSELADILNSDSDHGNVNCEASFLSNLSDDSLIDYVNRFSQEHDKETPLEPPKLLPPKLLPPKQQVVVSHVAAKQGSAAPSAVMTRGNYFVNKRLGQERQDEELKAKYGVRSDIFKNCTIYINGYTKPGRLQLHQEIILNGGKFLHYMSAKGNVTHIVASNLPLKKRLEFSKYKVVKPEWIVDSIAQRSLLPWQDYSIVTNTDDLQKQLPLVKAGRNSNHKNQITECTNPHFLYDYFAHSRLHHLSTWKSNLRAAFLNNYREGNFQLPTKGEPFEAFHIDFDCFFATVGFLHKPKSIVCDFEKDPIVVCHGSGNSDIASCNYVARRYGIKNGMWVKSAQAMLPRDIKLFSLPYNFEEIQKASDIFYEILQSMEWFKTVIPVSIDEAICIMQGSEDFSIETICQEIRKRIFHATDGCTVSIGCAPSLVLARLALKLAKPNGYHIITDDEIANRAKFWQNFNFDDLPGVGRSTVFKLKDYFEGSKNLQDLKKNPRFNLENMKSCIGDKIGTKIFLNLIGKDDDESTRIIFETDKVFERKSISIEINWGIRFQTITEIDNFLDICCTYLLGKMAEFDRLTSQVVMKIMKRASDAPVIAVKYMGMGKCDSFSHTSRLGMPTNDPGIIATELKSMYRILSCPPKELRGLSIQFNKLISPIERNQTVLPFPKIKKGAVENIPQILRREIDNELQRRKIDVPSPIKKISPIKRTRRDELPNTFEQQFLDELPTQIRAEVDNDLRISKKIKKSKIETIKKNIQDRQEIDKNKRLHFKGEDSIFKPIKFQGLNSFKDICNLIINWIIQTINDAGPHKNDVRLFKRYLVKLCDSNRTHLALRIARIISTQLTLSSNKAMDDKQSHIGVQEWDSILINIVIPILNRNKHTDQTKRKLDIEYDI